MFTLPDPRTAQLTQILVSYPNGATFSEIAAHFASIPSRTLHRWLAKLVFAGQIRRHGGSKNTRYFVGSGRAALPVKKRQPKPPPVPKPSTQTSTLSSTECPPVASRLSPEFQRVFDRIAPKIIKMGYVDDVATDELAHAVVRDLHADTELMNTFIEEAMAEFDALECAPTLAKYQLRQSHWDFWRPAWCRARDLSG